MPKIIYALKCPFTKEIHYVGKSTSGIVRPLSHMRKSHSDKINEWVESLKGVGSKPEIEILENVSDKINIDEREQYYIKKHLSKGNTLLNSRLYSASLVTEKFEKHLSKNSEPNIDVVSQFIKTRRKQVGLTQEEFAERAGVALTVLRKIEQGNISVNLSGLLTILAMFGHTINVSKI